VNRFAIAGFMAMILAAPAMASLSVRRSPYDSKLVDVYIVNERLTDAVGSLEMVLEKRVDLFIGDDPLVTYRARRVSPEQALRGIAAAAKVELLSDDERFEVRSPGEQTVTIDVKDGEARDIPKSMQRQCGIRNLLIDPQVQGTGTFLFTKVPCRRAFDVVLRTLGLAAETYSESMVSVGAAQH
jgi:hypothetical protein